MAERAEFKLDEVLMGNLKVMSDEEFAKLVGQIQQNQLLILLASGKTELEGGLPALPDIIREEVVRRQKLRSCA